MKKTVTTAMTKLMDLARNGEARPASRSPIGASLASYTNTNGQKRYPKFNEEIRKLAPHWLENTTNKNMAELMKLACTERPKSTTSLGDALRNYTQLRDLAPDWFDKK